MSFAGGNGRRSAAISGGKSFTTAVHENVPSLVHDDLFGVV